MDKTKLTVDTYNQVAQAYQDKFMDLDIYNATYDRFCDRVAKQHPAIFEIGCGPGNITRYLLTKRPDFKIEAIDLAPNMIKLAQINNPAADFKVMDCREIDTITSRYDGIMCGFCMPYLSKEECMKMIRDSAALLNSNGIIYCSVVEDAYEKSGLVTSSNGEHQVYIYCHEAVYLKQAFDENGFEQVDEFRISYPRPGKPDEIHLIFIARKK